MELSFLWVTVLCGYMTGVIWIIQLIHYPSFVDIKRDRFLEFHNKHTNQMGFIVGPVMLAELILGGYLARSLEPFWVFNFMAVLALFALTFFVSVPLHNKLKSEKNLSQINSLIKTNWYRTILWTLRLVILLATAHSK